jgi:hypothetical protein
VVRLLLHVVLMMFAMRVLLPLAVSLKSCEIAGSHEFNYNFR